LTRRSACAFSSRGTNVYRTLVTFDAA
jgi:hypothetical protein